MDNNTPNNDYNQGANPGNNQPYNQNNNSNFRDVDQPQNGSYTLNQPYNQNDQYNNGQMPYNQPVYTNNNNEEEDHLKGMAIASIVLGVVSILCCCCYGLNLLLAIIGLILGIIATIKGTGKGKSLGIVGLVISGISFAIGLVLICVFASTIDWSQVTPENLDSYKYIDPNDEEQVREWLQQFFKK